MSGERPPQPPPNSLRRELLAILVLYAMLAVLPLLAGWAFGPESP
jgi:hypothetical protein